MSRRVFSGWIRRYSVSQLHTDLAKHGVPVSRQAVNDWARGRSYPNPTLIPFVLKLSLGELRPADIVRPPLRWGRRRSR